jgi:hypothetical protein
VEAGLQAEQRAYTVPYQQPGNAPGVEPWLPLLEDIAASLRRLAEALAPDPGKLVGTGYIAKRLGKTTIYIAEMAREGKIPKKCIAKGTGEGKEWKFIREQIDRWIAEGRPRTGATT